MAKSKYAMPFEGSNYKINGVNIRDLCGWVPDEERQADFRSENGTLFQANPSLQFTDRKDVHLWLPLMKVKPRWQRDAQKIGSCFVAGTTVSGPDDSKPIEEIRVGERVYAGDGTITRVCSVEEKVSHQPLVTLETWGGIPLTVTADHKVLAYRFEPYEKRASGNHKRITKRLYERELSRRELQKSASTYTLDRPNKVIDAFEGRKAELVPAGELTTSDYLLSPLQFETDEKMPDHPILMTEEGQWMYGYFLGNGNWQKSTLRMVVPSKRPEIVERLEKCCESLGLPCRYRKHPDRNMFVFDIKGGGEFADSVRDMAYGHDQHKVLPSWGYKCKPIIEGLLAADGHVAKGGKVQHYDSTSESLATAVLWYFIMEGEDASIGFVSREGSPGTKDNAKPLFRVSVHKDRSRQRLWRDDEFLARPIKNITIQEGPHTVYDIGVTHESHTFMANFYAVSNCVAWGAELACTMLMAIQHLKGTSMFIEEAATEPIYGGCRVEALGKSRGGWSDGAFGAGAAKWLRDWGCILRLDYSADTRNPEHDLTNYSGKKEKDWGNYGCGGQNDNDMLDGAARQTPLQHCVAVDTVEEAAAAITNLYPITIASMAGFGDMVRDRSGICRISGRWAHQMMAGGVRWRGGEPQFRIFQSWGPATCSGPDPGITHKAISGCSWWCTAEDFAWILRTGDCWIFGDMIGLPEQSLDAALPASRWYQPNRDPIHSLAV